MLHFPFHRVIPFYRESRANQTKSPPIELDSHFRFSRSSQHSFSPKRAHRMKTVLNFFCLFVLFRKNLHIFLTGRFVKPELFRSEETSRGPRPTVCHTQSSFTDFKISRQTECKFQFAWNKDFGSNTSARTLNKAKTNIHVLSKHETSVFLSHLWLVSHFGVLEADFPFHRVIPFYRESRAAGKVLIFPNFPFYRVPILSNRYCTWDPCTF